MLKNELAKAGKNILTDLVKNDRLEGLPKVAAYTGLALLELAKLVIEAGEAKKQLEWHMPLYIGYQKDKADDKGGNYVRYH